MDPSGPSFFKSEDRAGEGVDILTSFCDGVNTVFPGKYKDPTDHPMYQYISKYSKSETPGAGGEYDQVTLELNDLSEHRKNMLNCEEIFTHYLRECS